MTSGPSLKRKLAETRRLSSRVWHTIRSDAGDVMILSSCNGPNVPREQFPVENGECAAKRIPSHDEHRDYPTPHKDPQNSTLDTNDLPCWWTDELVRCAARYFCCVIRCLFRPRLRRLVYESTIFLAVVHFGSRRGHEVSIYSLIVDATRLHVTQVVPDQSMYSLCERHYEKMRGRHTRGAAL